MDFMDSDQTQPPEDLPQVETDHNISPLLALECKSFKWKIQIKGNFLELDY